MSFTLIAGLASIDAVGGFFAGLLGFGGGGSHVSPYYIHRYWTRQGSMQRLLPQW